MKITGSGDCGNSPKNLFAQEVAIALEGGPLKEGMLDEAVTWARPGGAPPLEGLEAMRAALAEQEVVAIRVDHAMSHGRVGMANGETELPDGTRRRFAHVLTFTSAKGNKVARIQSYG
ncbi:hypothetical protein ACXN5S_17250 [Pseudoroseicyclus sp. H15]